jgi:glycosyltransferase involved in cell wall biosynthesis
MDKKKIVVLTDMDFKGSGYFYLMSTILNKLSSEYDIKVVGLGYRGEEHNYGFSITPVDNFKDAVELCSIIIQIWKPDLIVCGMDVPMQLEVFKALSVLKKKYIAITPLENPPLTLSWAAGLMMMDWVFFISKMGTQAALDVGLTKVSHIDVTVNQEVFHPATTEERNEIRKSFGYTDDEYVILTVADNQERKNLWASLSIVSKLKKAGNKIRYVLVTREHSPVGHNLRDLCTSLDINKETLILERGITQEHLRSLYVSSDLFLLTSKAEGLGLPILEAMSCGLEVAATDTGAIHELLEDHRGILLEGYKLDDMDGFIDVWGNSLRTLVNIGKATTIIDTYFKYNLPDTEKASKFMQEKNMDVPTETLRSKIEELTNEK